MTAGTLSPRRFRMACWALIAVGFVLQVLGMLHRNVHWDEFIFLTRVHALHQGWPLPTLQTAYAWLFRWLPSVAGNEVAQVQAGRGALLALWPLTLLLLYRLARHAVAAPAALAAVALAAILREDVIHAASFRIDGLLAPAFLGACLAAMGPSPRRAAWAGVLAGLMLVLSIKAALLLPVVAILVLVAPGPERRRGLAMALWMGSMAVTSVALLGLHHAFLPSPVGGVGGGPTTTADFLRNAAVRMLVDGGPLPRLGTLLASARWSAPAWALLVVGVAAALRGWRAGPGASSRALRLQVLFAAPLALFLFYRNYFPYAFVSLAPTLWIPAGAAWWSAARARNPVGRWAAWGTFVFLLGVQIPTGREIRADGTVLQRQTLEVVHGLFPQPVPYIDRTGMVSSFPRPLFNMTTFGMETYRSRGTLALSTYIDAYAPPFLILNTSTLAVFPGDPWPDPEPRPGLLPQDAQRVRETFTHFWGPLFLAGHRWDRLEAEEAASFPIHVPGPYTLLGPGAVTVDGVAVEPGESVHLDRGSHRIASADGALDGVGLVWGQDVRIPETVPASGPVFRGF